MHISVCKYYPIIVVNYVSGSKKLIYVVTCTNYFSICTLDYKIFYKFVSRTKGTMDLTTEVKAYIKRGKNAGEIIRVVPDMETESKVQAYRLYTAFENSPDYLGRILFDTQGYWIYDGSLLSISEQEQLARFIINYRGAV